MKKILLASSFIASLALGSIQDELMNMDRKISLIGDGADIVQAGDGEDRISTGNGGDTVCAVAGADKIATGNGDDFIILGMTVM